MTEIADGRQVTSFLPSLEPVAPLRHMYESGQLTFYDPEPGQLVHLMNLRAQLRIIGVEARLDTDTTRQYYISVPHPTQDLLHQLSSGKLYNDAGVTTQQADQNTELARLLNQAKQSAPSDRPFLDWQDNGTLIIRSRNILDLQAHIRSMDMQVTSGTNGGDRYYLAVNNPTEALRQAVAPHDPIIDETMGSWQHANGTLTQREMIFISTTGVAPDKVRQLNNVLEQAGLHPDQRRAPGYLVMSGEAAHAFWETIGAKQQPQVAARSQNTL